MDREPEWYVRAEFDVQEFSVNGIRTFAVVEGRRDQLPVIFLHGVPGGAFMWEYAIAALGRKRLAVAPDFPGWGRSLSRFGTQLPTPTPAWSLAWLNGVLAAQNIERFDLIAHGSGCWLALEQLLQDSSRVRRLGLISPRLWPHHLLFSRFRRTWTESRVRRWLGRQSGLTSEARARHARDFAESRSAPLAAPMLREDDFAAHFANYWRALSEFHGRSLLIWGERDPAYSANASSELETNMDRPEVHRLGQSGHFPMLDEPHVVTSVLREFLED